MEIGIYAWLYLFAVKSRFYRISNSCPNCLSFSFRHTRKYLTSASSSVIGISTRSELLPKYLFAVSVLNDGRTEALTISSKVKRSFCIRNLEWGIFLTVISCQKPISDISRKFSPSRSEKESAASFASLCVGGSEKNSFSVPQAVLI